MTKHAMHKRVPNYPTPPLSAQFNADTDGAVPPDEQVRPVRISSSSKQVFEFWKGIGQQVNDNSGMNAKKKRMGAIGVVILLAIIGAVVIGVNNAAVMTEVAMHSNGAVMSGMMEVSPDSVAYMLNQIEVGE